MTKKVFITRNIMDSGLRALKEEGFELDIWESSTPPSKDEIISRAAGCEALITMLCDDIDDEVLSKLSSLKVVSNYAVGHNNIDSKSATKRSIAVGNTPDVLTLATAEMALTLTMAAARHTKESTEFIKEGEWKTWGPMDFLGKEITGSTVGIIGAGRIGKAYASILKNGFNCEVIYFNRNSNLELESELDAKLKSLEQLVSQSDIISVHCPLNEQSKGMLNLDLLRNMKDDAILINTARGEIHNEDDLLELLELKKKLVIGLDVTNPEPMNKDSQLLHHPRVIVSPHIGSATRKARQAMSLIVAQNTINALRGEKLPGDVNNLFS